MTDRRGFLAGLLALVFGWKLRRQRGGSDPRPFLDYARREVARKASADVYGTPLLEQRDPETGLTPNEAQREINNVHKRLLAEYCDLTLEKHRLYSLSTRRE